MFLDQKGHGEPWGSGRLCKSCRAPIAVDEPVEELRFGGGSTHDLEQLNGVYHTRCAGPILSAKRALDLLSRFPFG